MIRDQVCLSSQLRDPKAMIDIGRSQLEEGRCRRSAGTHRNVEFICGNYVVFRVPKLPPELMSDDGDIESRLGLWRVLDGEDNACRCEEKNDHNQDGDH